MQVRMQNAEELNREQISEFLRASEGIEFQGQNRAETYAWVQRVLVGREYASRGKRERGEVRAYLSKVTDLSLPQVTRLIRMYRETGNDRSEAVWAAAVCQEIRTFAMHTLKNAMGITGFMAGE